MCGKCASVSVKNNVKHQFSTAGLPQDDVTEENNLDVTVPESFESN